VGSISTRRPHEPKSKPSREPIFVNGRTGTPPGELPDGAAAIPPSPEAEPPRSYNATALFGTAAEWRRDLAIAAAAGVFLGVAGPFGSYLSPGRLIVIAYWTGAILTGEILLGLTIRPATLLAPRLRVPPILAASLVTAIVSLPLSFLCHTVALTLWPILRGHISLLTFYGQTLLVAGTLTAIHAQSGRPLTRAPTEDTAPRPTPTAGDFRSRIPSHLGADLIALQMEDHYVRVHTSAGSGLVLIPLHQALAELGAVPGLRVHRSWWVAHHAVIGTIRDGRNVRLRLVNGLEAPVSRARLAEARKALLFAADG
jgi:hypothetical protein